MLLKWFVFLVVEIKEGLFVSTQGFCGVFIFPEKCGTMLSLQLHNKAPLLLVSACILAHLTAQYDGVCVLGMLP